ncbi:HWE histidine kinase domain-containing protein [Erythrobacter sp.]|uniref:sensor histidine kinase n=1 Tax=Erythrobacter sp. TaxID=1042 RepID=UPI001425C35B|nr:HWE histidine kinase domain-containing protein [Erythrobacter sp.]QIQ87275.1 MAG: PAS domain-containing protein [Erythrobacter sp.]
MRRPAAKDTQLTQPEPSPWPNGTPPARALCAEEERLHVLASFEIDTLDGDPELARLARFAAHLCETPQAAVSIVEAERQYFVARTGWDTDNTARATSICATTMTGGDILEVHDASADQRFAGFEAVAGQRHLRFYAGAPLVSAEGAPLGALCVTDSTPRPGGLSDIQREGLLVLAEAVKRRIETHRQARRNVAEMKASADRLQFVLDSVPDIAWSASPGGQFDYFNARFSEVTGQSAPRDVEDWRTVIHPDDYDASLAKLTEAMENATLFEDEWRLRIADGSYRWVLSRAVPSSSDPQTARWFGTITDIDDTHRISEERELLAGELAHRIKNIFSVITGLISLHARGAATHREFAQVLTEHVRALSRAHDYALQLGEHRASNLADLLRVLLAPYGVPGADAVIISGETIEPGRRAATPLALAFHELATNSAKYGALASEGGRVAVHLAKQDGKAVIEWTESGGPETDPPEGEGFGSRLMKMAIERQLGGSMAQEWRREGLHARIAIPLDQIAR